MYISPRMYHVYIIRGGTKRVKVVRTRLQKPLPQAVRVKGTGKSTEDN